MRIERWYWLIAFCILSLCINYGLLHSVGFPTPTLPSQKAGEIEVTLEPLPDPKPASKAALAKPEPKPKPVVAKQDTPKRNPDAALAEKPTPKREKPVRVALNNNTREEGRRPLPLPAKNLENENRATKANAVLGGMDRLQEEKPLTSGLPVGHLDAGLPRPVNKPAGGGGAPSPDPNLTGHGGAPGPVTRPDELIYNGGGRGGVKLPKVAPMMGGGGGRSILSVDEKDPLASIIPEDKPGEGPGAGSGAGMGKGGGVGYSRGKGIGTRLDGTQALGALRVKPGTGIGAGEGDKIGTTPPGGGHGTGADTPGTGGEGLGYGRGKGIGSGDGSGVGVGDGAGARAGRIRGIPFGDVTGLLNGDPKGGGGTGGGPGGIGRGAVFGAKPTGIRGGSLHIVYCLDVSGSMVNGHKIEKAKEELKKAISELHASDTFDIVTFSRNISVYSPQMLPANTVNIIQANAWIDNAGLAGGTNLCEALVTALGLGSLTTVYVMTDGDPTAGETDPARIRARVKLANGHNIQINALDLMYHDRNEAAELLKALATENNGLYRLIDMAQIRLEK